MNETIKQFFCSLYHKLVEINDTPHRKAAGLGIGVFCGILPFMGPVAALLIAWIFQANRAAAFLGGLVTNMWLSWATFFIAAKTGAMVTGQSWGEIYEQCKELIKNFHFKDLFDASILEIMKPLMIGYAIIGALLAVGVYFITIFILLRRGKKVLIRRVY